MKKITLLILTLIFANTLLAQYNIDDTQNYTFTDISATGTALNLGDDGETNITAPFTIHLGNATSTQLRVGNNGAILFDATTGDISSLNAPLTTGAPMIAPFWDDFDSEMGNVYTKVTDQQSLPGGQTIATEFTIQWDRVHFNGSSNTDMASFQVVFRINSTDIIFIYADTDMDGTDYDDGASATIGVATDDAVSQYSYDTASLSGVTTLVFSLPKTYVPDDNFEAYLETHDAAGNSVGLGGAGALGDGQINNDYVPTAKIEGLTELDIYDQNIADLTGIEDFVALTKLTCYQNDIANLDVSNNINLTDLSCFNNNLTSLDVSANTALTTLHCGSNAFTTLNLNNNNQLEKLSVQSSPDLATLHIQNGANNLLSGTYTYGSGTIERFRANNCPNLTCIYVDNATDANNGVNDYQDWAIDATAHFVETQAECDAYYTTSIPDTNFEAYLETHNAAGNTVALGAADSMGNGVIDDQLVPTSRIENVTSLDVHSQGIADLTGIEDFMSLTHLKCYQNGLITNLDVSNNTALTYLDCSHTNISSLDVSNNTALTTLNFYSTNLTSIDLSTNTDLQILHCTFTNLTGLDLSANTNLRDLYCYDTNLTSLDVSNNTALRILYCGSNNLTSLDLSANTNLFILDCSDNNLTSLNLSANTALEELNCDGNSLTEIDLDNNSLLEIVEIQNNPNLTALHIQNGANNLLSGTYTIGSNTYSRFIADNKPSLTCIYVDNATDANNDVNDYQDWLIDATAHFVETQAECDNYYTTSIPDTNFEAYLETHNAAGNTVALGAADSMGNGVIDDHLVPTSRIENVVHLSVNNQNITDLTGIEDFVALTELFCYQNDIANLDVSNNINLTKLGCFNNNLANLDVSANTALTTLFCSNNALATLNLNNNNQLEKLSVHSSPNLTTLHIQNGANGLLAGTYTVGSNTYSRFIADNNPNLTCIYVDNAADANNGVNDYQDWAIDATATYVETEAECNALDVADNQIEGLSMYPNPVNNTLHITANENINHIGIYNMLGQEVQSISPASLSTTIDFSSLAKGAYFIKIQINNQTGTYKIIK